MAELSTDATPSLPEAMFYCISPDGIHRLDIFDPSQMFEPWALYTLLGLGFIFMSDLDDDDDIFIVEAYPDSYEGQFPWHPIQQPFSPPSWAREAWLLSYRQHCYTRRVECQPARPSSPEPRMILDNSHSKSFTRKRANSISPSERGRGSIASKQTVSKPKSSSTASTGRKNRSVRKVAPTLLRVHARPSFGRTRSAHCFFEWKRQIWTPGGSPLKNELQRDSCSGRRRPSMASSIDSETSTEPGCHIDAAAFLEYLLLEMRSKWRDERMPVQIEEECARQARLLNSLCEA